jgi:excisionase family DNA binding protein
MALKTLPLDQLEQFFYPMAKPLAGAYTVKSASQALDVNRQRIYQLIDSGALNAVKVVDQEGDLIQVLISKKSVQEFLDYRKSDGKVPRPSYA